MLQKEVKIIDGKSLVYSGRKDCFFSYFLEGVNQYTSIRTMLIVLNVASLHLTILMFIGIYVTLAYRIYRKQGVISDLIHFSYY